MSTINPLCIHTFLTGEKILRQIKTIAGRDAQGMNRKTARCGLAAKNAVATPMRASRIGAVEGAHARRTAQTLPIFCAGAASGLPRAADAHHCKGLATGAPGSASGRVEPDGSGAAGRALPTVAVGAGSALARCSISAPRLSMALA